MRLVFLCTIFLLVIMLFSCGSDKRKIDKITTTKIDSLKLLAIIQNGEKIFNRDCNVCHARTKTDYKLNNIVPRLGFNYIKLYITKQDSLILAKDKYALALKSEYGNAGNSHNFKYSDFELLCLTGYLR
ncbi:MAG: hypothetical protein ACOVO1_00060 [Chitinophagaceae bacterium]